MKVIVDQDKCVGSGQCVMMSEAVFDQRDEDGVVVLLQDEPAEVFVILCLTTKFQVIAYHEIGRGTLDSVLVNPRLCSAQHKRGYVAAAVMLRSGGGLFSLRPERKGFRAHVLGGIVALKPEAFFPPGIGGLLRL